MSALSGRGRMYGWVLRQHVRREGRGSEAVVHPDIAVLATLQQRRREIRNQDRLRVLGWYRRYSTRGTMQIAHVAVTLLAVSSNPRYGAGMSGSWSVHNSSRQIFGWVLGRRGRGGAGGAVIAHSHIAVLGVLQEVWRGTGWVSECHPALSVPGRVLPLWTRDGVTGAVVAHPGVAVLAV